MINQISQPWTLGFSSMKEEMNDDSIFEGKGHVSLLRDMLISIGISEKSISEKTNYIFSAIMIICQRWTGMKGERKDNVSTLVDMSAKSSSVWGFNDVLVLFSWEMHEYPLDFGILFYLD